MTSPGVPTLRERKRERTRAAIVAAGTDLFARVGYDETTVADIAAAADIGTRTFFSYFASKEELLFPASDARVSAALRAIDARRPGDRPVDVLLQSLLDVRASDDDDLVGGLAGLRMSLMRTVPAVRGRSLQVQLDAQCTIAQHLAQAFPELGDVDANAIVGAFIGAVTGALGVLLAGPADALDASGAALTRDELFARVHGSVRQALAPR